MVEKVLVFKEKVAKKKNKNNNFYCTNAICKIHKVNYMTFNLI